MSSVARTLNKIQDCQSSYLSHAVKDFFSFIRYEMRGIPKDRTKSLTHPEKRFSSGKMAKMFERERYLFPNFLPGISHLCLEVAFTFRLKYFYFLHQKRGWRGKRRFPL